MKKKMIPIFIIICIALSGCSSVSSVAVTESSASAYVSDSTAAFEKAEVAVGAKKEAPAESTTEEVAAEEPAITESDLSSPAFAETDASEPISDVPAPADLPTPADLPDTITFVDVYGESYTVDFDKERALHLYDVTLFVREGDAMYYRGDSSYTSRLGIDVSHHQGSGIDWQKVAESGVEFVIVRVGYRGYGINSGNVNEDRYAAKNIKNALAAGLDVGVYFFSQAITEDEALEEAQFVLDFFKRNNLTTDEITLPVVFDPESILKDDARTDGVSGEQFTKNTRVFCDAIRDAGFEPMVYSNMLWEAYMLDLNELSDIPVWYADYEERPQTPYDFKMWQYSEKIHVPGISGNMDGNILLIPAEE